VPAPSGLELERLAVVDAQVAFEDTSKARPFSKVLGPLSFELRNFHTAGDPRSPYQFLAVSGDGERLAWNGTLSAIPLKSQGEFVLENIDLPRFAPYFSHLLKGELRSAFADFSGNYTFSLDADGMPRFSLEKGAVTLREVRFGGAGVVADTVSLRQLALRGIQADLATWQASLASAALEGVRLKMTRDATGLDLLRLLMADNQGAPGTPAAKPADANGVSGASAGASGLGAGFPRLAVGEISLSDVQVDLVDQTTARQAEHRIDDVRLKLLDLHTGNLAKELSLSMEVDFPRGGHLALKGTAALAPWAADLAVDAEGVALTSASPYLEALFNLRIASGALNTQGRVALREGTVDFAGDVGVQGLTTFDTATRDELASCADISATSIQLSTRPRRLHAKELRFVEPKVFLLLETDRQWNFVRAAEGAVADGGKPQVPAMGGAAAEGPLDISLASIAFERAEVRFEDRSIAPVARWNISELGGVLLGVRSEAAARVEVDLRGRVGGVAPVALKGKLNPFSDYLFMDLQLTAQGVDLPAGAGPYIAKYAGRSLERGRLSLTAQAKLSNRRVDTNSVVTLDQFYLGEKSGSAEATKLPVELALSLLRDTRGNIVIDLPVRGSLDDPNFKLSRVLLRVLTNTLTKVAVSPFSLVGGLFGGGGEELGWLDFPAGSAVLDEIGIQKLATLAKALQARPALRLGISGTYAPDGDGAGLRRERLEQRLRTAAKLARRINESTTPGQEEAGLSPQERVAALERLYAEEFLGLTAGPEAATGSDLDRQAKPSELAFVGRSLASNNVSDAAQGRSSFGRLPKFSKVKLAPEARAVLAQPDETKAAVKVGQPALTVQIDGAEVVDAGEGSLPTPAPVALAPEVLELRLLEKIEISDSEVQALGAARAQALKAWLVAKGKVAPERIFLTPVTDRGTRVNINLQ